MTNSEFKNLFDILYNNITSNQAVGLNSYEKSVFLTKAQLEIIKNHYTIDLLRQGKGFDGNRKRLTDFSMLMKTKSVSLVEPDLNEYTLSPFSYKYTISNSNLQSIVENEDYISDVFIVINELIIWEETIGSGSSAKVIRHMRQVLPIDYLDYNRISTKPYPYPNKRQVWRLTTNNEFETRGLNNDNVYHQTFEYIFNPEDYKKQGDKKLQIRYIRRPTPIILDNLAIGLSIEGYSSKQECQLDPSLHDEILLRAVELAKLAWQGDALAVITAGERSE